MVGKIVYIEKDAKTEGSKYRYLLTRKWSETPRLAVFIMLNPSTADDKKDDRTIQRCTNFAAEHGCGRMEVVNLFAYRATRPLDLKKAEAEGFDVVGPENDRYILEAVKKADVVIAAWGTDDLAHDRGERVISILANADLHHKLFCLGKTEEGAPKHPLYVNKSKRVEEYEVRWMPLYFAYGSNMSLDQMRKRVSPAIEPKFVAWMDNAELCFPRDSVNQKGGVASYRTEKGERMYGAVFDLCERGVGALDGHEGFVPEGKDNAYERLYVTVYDLSGNPHLALTYKANEKGEYLPSSYYMLKLITGAVECGLPSEYVAKLKDVKTNGVE